MCFATVGVPTVPAKTRLESRFCNNETHFVYDGGFRDSTLCAWFRSVACKQAKPVVYCGDLNVAPHDADLSHPSCFKQPTKISHEFRRTNSNSTIGTGKVPEEHVGQPGCTPCEREAFHNLLQAGSLVDCYRELNVPVGRGGIDDRLPLTEVYKQSFTWRGRAEYKNYEKDYSNTAFQQELYVASPIRNRMGVSTFLCWVRGVF